MCVAYSCKHVPVLKEQVHVLAKHLFALVPRVWWYIDKVLIKQSILFSIKTCGDRKWSIIILCVMCIIWMNLAIGLFVWIQHKKSNLVNVSCEPSGYTCRVKLNFFLSSPPVFLSSLYVSYIWFINTWERQKAETPSACVIQSCNLVNVSIFIDCVHNSLYIYTTHWGYSTAHRSWHCIKTGKWRNT